MAAEIPVNAEKKAITGYSMGGHGALICHLKIRGTYSAVSAFAPICNPTQVCNGHFLTAILYHGLRNCFFFILFIYFPPYSIWTFISHFFLDFSFTFSFWTFISIFYSQIPFSIFHSLFQRFFNFAIQLGYKPTFFLKNAILI